MKKLILSILVAFIISIHVFFVFFCEFNLNDDTVNFDQDNIENNPEQYLDLCNLGSKLRFIENNGQLDNDQVRYYTKNEDIWFTSDGVFFEIRDELSINSHQSTVRSPISGLMTDDYRPTTSEYRRVVLKQEFVGSNKIQPKGIEPLSGG